MANTPKSEKKKTKNLEITETEGKTKKKKDRDPEKEENKKKNNNNNKKLKLSNGNSKQRDKEGKEGADGDEEAKTHVFPMNRIRTIIKSEDSELRASQEAILVINKATEKFLEQFTQDAYACAVQDRKKSLSYKNLALVVSKQRRFDFLFDFIPEKVKAEDALKERNSGGNGVG
ncbi:hypothetical protein RJT34_29901 [Clitoria ternatea]|uniref:Transcription factor CBF/NF-Y/archaeal histone domain-containing protein n=1 Tax=Clitoria ternatea TaxID=43366 RepID=A0AAN9ESC7_CLITE